MHLSSPFIARRVFFLEDIYYDTFRARLDSLCHLTQRDEGFTESVVIETWCKYVRIYLPPADERCNLHDDVTLKHVILLQEGE